MMFDDLHDGASFSDFKKERLNALLCQSVPLLTQEVKEIDRVKLEMEAAEHDYDLNRAAELKYGTLMSN
ncbi:hypothetical protein AgCh_001958 [Apium graveolens]